MKFVLFCCLILSVVVDKKFSALFRVKPRVTAVTSLYELYVTMHSKYVSVIFGCMLLFQRKPQYFPELIVFFFKPQNMFFFSWNRDCDSVTLFSCHHMTSRGHIHVTYFCETFFFFNFRQIQHINVYRDAEETFRVWPPSWLTGFVSSRCAGYLLYVNYYKYVSRQKSSCRRPWPTPWPQDWSCLV